MFIYTSSHLFFLFFGRVVRSQKAQNTRTTSVTRIYHDEFHSGNKKSNVNEWEFVEGTGENGWGTGQKQYYTVNVDKNARCENGRVIIEARKENYKGCEYTSARLRSKQSFRYGRFEVRIGIVFRHSLILVLILRSVPSYLLLKEHGLLLFS